MSSPKLFITGGSGYIGSVVIEYALADGYIVTALSRAEPSDAKLQKLGATPVRGDLESFDVLESEAAKADVVINMADSMASDHTLSMDERFAINNGAIAALAAGLKGSGKPLIFTGGSLQAAADPRGKETDESSPGWPEDHPLGWTLRGWRKSLVHAENGVGAMYVRLAPYVYGRGKSGVALFMGMWSRAGAGFFIDEGKARTTTIHVEDAARLYLLLAQKGWAGESYNGTSETHVTQGEIARAICRSINVPCHSLSCQEAASRGPLANFFSAENRASNKKAREELGWEIKAEKGILDEIRTGSYVRVAEKLRKADA
ncbi:putative NAD dependent epimerase/dehydratase [Massarina eburnea CBS 473.64]|uniref:Putative NAD dependent epimerase/dehydratase n=1 Tax=Massarina eburnea CBS 473.64 TaxID=1395130 RepID=A0A6A6SCY0_9PLEO|nr:putative NAD dependent epimerase/dehydratase [Massarina eburnea CBS 473.64]